MTTLAGSATNVFGNVDGVGTSASFTDPWGMALWGGVLYVADSFNCRIRKVSSDGESVDAAKSLSKSKSLSSISPKLSIELCVCGFVGTVTAFVGSWGSVDGVGASAGFNQPRGVTVDSTGTFFVADSSNNRIRQVTSSGRLSAFTDSLSRSKNSSMHLLRSFWQSNSLTGLFLFVVASTGSVTTLAGSSAGFADGWGSNAKLSNPHGIAVDSLRTMYVADTSNRLVRMVTTSGDCSLFCSNTSTAAKLKAAKCWTQSDRLNIVLALSLLVCLGWIL